MSRTSIPPEQRERFDAAEKLRIAETSLARPALRPTEASLRAHFGSAIGRAQTPLENPHLEPRVGERERARAVPAAVLIAVVLREPAPTVIVTLRPPGISFPGHWVFPGGRSDVDDATSIETALREAHEEIGLAPDRIEVLGRLGDYVSHSGFRIAPVVGLVSAPVELEAQPEEVEAIAEIPLTRLLDSGSYLLYRFQGREGRAHFAFDGGDDEIMLTGVTASIAICLYRELSKTHVD